MFPEPRRRGDQVSWASGIAHNPRVESDGLPLPEIRYARNGGVAIAYQVVGEGDVDLVYVPEWTSNLVYGWEYRRWREFHLRLARSFRLILFDKRGTGLPDHGGQFATLRRGSTLVRQLDAGRSEPRRRIRAQPRLR